MWIRRVITSAASASLRGISLQIVDNGGTDYLRVCLIDDDDGCEMYVFRETVTLPLDCRAIAAMAISFFDYGERPVCAMRRPSAARRA